MNTTKVESALAVMAIIILCVLFYNHNQLNNLIVKTVKNETRIQNNADLIRRNVNSINTNAVAIESNKKSIKSIWRDCKNTKNKIAEIQKLQQDLEKQNVAKIQKLQQDLEKLKKITARQGDDVDKIAKLVFDFAYGHNSQKKWNHYVNTNSNYRETIWDEAISMLNASHVQKLLEIRNIQKETKAIKKRLERLKPKCFKKK